MPHGHKQKTGTQAKTASTPIESVSSPTLTPSLIKRWFTEQDAFDQYKNWVQESKDVADRLEKLAATLRSIQEETQQWLACADSNTLHTFIGQGIASLNENLSAVSSNKNAKRIVQAVAIFLDVFLSLQSEFTFFARFNPAKLFHLLKTVGTKGSLYMPSLASIVGAIGHLIQGNLFLIQTYDARLGRLENFEKDWEEGIAWLEQSCHEFPLTPAAINSLLNGLAKMATTARLPRPMATTLINQLLYKLVNPTFSTETVLAGLEPVEILVNQLALADITTLDTDLLMDIWEKTLEEKSTPKDSGLCCAKIIEKIAHVLCKINLLVKPIKHIPHALLTRALLPLPFAKPVVTYTKAKSKFLLSVGQILQSSGENIEETSALQEAVNGSISQLNDEKNTSHMSLADMGHTLYMLVISKKRSTWLDSKQTENLVKVFLKKLRTEKARYKPRIKPEKLDMAVQQCAEYLCWAKQLLPKIVCDHLKSRRPLVREDSLQHIFVIELQKQPWFKARFTYCDGEKDIEEILVAGNYVFVDVAFKDKETGKIFVIQIDGYIYHLFRQTQNQRQDDYLKELGIDTIRIPTQKYSTVLAMLVFTKAYLGGSQEKAMEQPLTLTQDTDKKSVEPDPKPKYSPSINKPQSLVSLKPLYRAIDDQKIKPVSTFLASLKQQGVFEQDGAKADAVAHVVDQFEPNLTILKTLIDMLSVVSITSLTKTGESPLVKAAASGKLKVVETFIGKTTAEERQSKMQEWQAALSVAQAKRKTEVVKCLTHVGISVPTVDTTPIAERKKPSSKPMLESQKAEHRKPSSAPMPKLEDAEEKATFTKDKDSKFYMLHMFDCRCAFCHYRHDSPWGKQVEALAYAGDALAQYHWSSQFYDFIRHEPKDEKQLFFWLEQSAAQNCAMAQQRLALIYAMKALNSRNPSETEIFYKRAFGFFQLAANAGLAGSQYDLAICYWEGIGTEKDETKAFEYFKSVADKGFRRALIDVGSCYRNGEGVEKDEKEGIRYYQLAAQEGMQDAHFYLGISYKFGQGVPADEKEAVKHFELAAQQGHMEAQHNTAICYKEGEGVPFDLQKAAMWYGKAAAQGSEKSQLGIYQAGLRYLEGDSIVSKDEKKGFSHLLSAADYGVKEAQHAVGISYYKGLGVPFDLQKAAMWFKKAAKQGLKEAQFDLGKMGAAYIEGRGVVPKDEKKGFSYLLSAADYGLPEAQYGLGICYFQGKGVAFDLEKSSMWFERAAAQGYKKAQLWLHDVGVRYLQGDKAVTKDEKKGFSHLLSAAKYSVPEAQHQVGLCYFHGRGAPFDLEKAGMWFEKAATQGNKDAQGCLYDVGVRYLNGQDVGQNLSEALRWLVASKQQGYQAAIATLEHLEDVAFKGAEECEKKKEFEQALGIYRFISKHGSKKIREKAQQALVRLSPYGGHKLPASSTKEKKEKQRNQPPSASTSPPDRAQVTRAVEVMQGRPAWLGSPLVSPTPTPKISDPEKKQKGMSVPEKVSSNPDSINCVIHRDPFN